MRFCTQCGHGVRYFDFIPQILLSNSYSCVQCNRNYKSVLNKISAILFIASGLLISKIIYKSLNMGLYGLLVTVCIVFISLIGIFYIDYIKLFRSRINGDEHDS